MQANQKWAMDFIVASLATESGGESRHRGYVERTRLTLHKLHYQE